MPGRTPQTRCASRSVSVGSVSVGRDLQNSMVRLQLINPMVLTQLQLSTWSKSTFQLDWSPFDNQLDWSQVKYQLDCPTVESQLTCFSKYPSSLPIASGHDVIHTQAPFSIWGILWQLWLSYPLHTSVKLYPMSVHLIWEPICSKPNQTEW